MWVYRLGLEPSKRMLLTGDVIDGKEAHRIGLHRVGCDFALLLVACPNELFIFKGLVSYSVDESELEATVEKVAMRLDFNFEISSL